MDKMEKELFILWHSKEWDSKRYKDVDYKLLFLNERERKFLWDIFDEILTPLRLKPCYKIFQFEEEKETNEEKEYYFYELYEENYLIGDYFILTKKEKENISNMLNNFHKGVYFFVEDDEKEKIIKGSRNSQNDKKILYEIELDEKIMGALLTENEFLLLKELEKATSKKRFVNKFYIKKLKDYQLEFDNKENSKIKNWDIYNRDYTDECVGVRVKAPEHIIEQLKNLIFETDDRLEILESTDYCVEY